MSDLTEFLLARLADDELEAGNCHVLGCMLFTSFDEGWCDCPAPARVLAEVAAKRALFAAVDADKDPFDAMGAETAYESLVWEHLALAYAAHPDYRQEWRP